MWKTRFLTSCSARGYRCFLCSLQLNCSLPMVFSEIWKDIKPNVFFVSMILWCLHFLGGSSRWLPCCSSSLDCYLILVHMSTCMTTSASPRSTQRLIHGCAMSASCSAEISVTISTTAFCMRYVRKDEAMRPITVLHHMATFTTHHVATMYSHSIRQSSVPHWLGGTQRAPQWRRLQHGYRSSASK